MVSKEVGRDRQTQLATLSVWVLTTPPAQRELAIALVENVRLGRLRVSDWGKAGPRFVTTRDGRRFVERLSTRSE
jgi:hypothetical protein